MRVILRKTGRSIPCNYLYSHVQKYSLNFLQVLWLFYVCGTWNTSNPKVELIKARIACKNSHPPYSSLLGMFRQERCLCLKNRNFKLMMYNLSEIWLVALIGRHSSYRKIPKISPGAYIFQRPFLRGLFLEGLVFGGAYVRREICVSKSIGLACSGKEIYHFCFVLLCNQGQILITSPPGGLYSEGRFNEGFLALRFWGAYI